MSNVRYFQNGVFSQWGSEKKSWKFFEYGHIIYHFKAFSMLINNLIRTKVLELTVKKLLVLVSLVIHYRTLKKKKKKKKKMKRNDYY